LFELTLDLGYLFFKWFLTHTKRSCKPWRGACDELSAEGTRVPGAFATALEEKANMLDTVSKSVLALTHELRKCRPDQLPAGDWSPQ